MSQETGHQRPLEERHRSITVEATSTSPDVQDLSYSIGCHRRGGGSEGGTISDSETASSETCFIRDMWKAGWTLRDPSKKPLMKTRYTGRDTLQSTLKGLVDPFRLGV